MVFGICLLVFIYILWLLVIKGLLWKMIVAFFGWIGMYLVCENVATLHGSGITIFDTVVSWSILIPSIIVMLAMAYTKSE